VRKVDWETAEIKALDERITSTTKIYISLIQILSALPFVLDFTFPIRFEGILSIGSVVNLNLMNEIALTCDHNFDYIDFLVMITLAPIAVAILFIVVYCSHLYIQVRRRKRNAISSHQYIATLNCTWCCHS
jgi:hypothetical protein